MTTREWVGLVLAVLTAFAVGLVAGVKTAPAPVHVMAAYGIPQSQFNDLTKGTGAIYIPYSGTGDHYELVGIAVVTGNVNNRIRVIVLDRNGQPAFNVVVRHSFGTEFERFPFVGDPVQFNLGSGSHYSVPDDPPDHIVVEGFPSDEVRVGNANIVGFAHTDWVMTFQLKGTAAPPAATATPTAGATPDTTPPAPGECRTKAQFHVCFMEELRNLAGGN